MEERLNPQETLWKILVALAGVAAAATARNALVGGWKKRRGYDPPANPADPNTEWGEAVTWALLTGALVGLARLLAARGAAEGWRKATGAYPPGLEEVG